MQLREICPSDPVSVRPTNTIGEAVGLMKRENVGAVVVLDGQEVQGILTDRDIALALGTGEAITGTPVSEVMTKEVVTIWEDQGIFNATQYMMGHKIRRLPIINRRNEVVGMVTADDLVGLFGRELLNIAKAVEPSLKVTV